MEFKGIDKAVNSSHSVTVGNTKYSAYHMTEHPQQQNVLNYSVVGLILVFLIVCIGIVMYNNK
jgi:hypothetical protein